MSRLDRSRGAPGRSSGTQRRGSTSCRAVRRMPPATPSHWSSRGICRGWGTTLCRASRSRCAEDELVAIKAWLAFKGMRKWLQRRTSRCSRRRPHSGFSCFNGSPAAGAAERDRSASQRGEGDCMGHPVTSLYVGPYAQWLVPLERGGLWPPPAYPRSPRGVLSDEERSWERLLDRGHLSWPFNEGHDQPLVEVSGRQFVRYCAVPLGARAGQPDR